MTARHWIEPFVPAALAVGGGIALAGVIAPDFRSLAALAAVAAWGLTVGLLWELPLAQGGDRRREPMKLEPGATYAIQLRRRVSALELEAIQQHVNAAGHRADCRFVLLVEDSELLCAARPEEGGVA